MQDNPLASLQSDTYRAMRTTAQKAWQRTPCNQSGLQEWHNFTPSTNSTWLAHLCEVIAFTASGEQPLHKLSKKDGAALRKFRCAHCCACQAGCPQCVFICVEGSPRTAMAFTSSSTFVHAPLSWHDKGDGGVRTPPCNQV